MNNANQSLTYVHRVTKRSGKFYLYYRKGRFRAPLPNASEWSDEFMNAYREAERQSDVFHEEERERGAGRMPDAKRNALFGTILRAAGERASRRGLPCTITMDDLEQMFFTQKGRCALTGIKIHDKKSERCVKKPFSASLDRIDSRIGYTPENVRLVCQIANNARHSYTDDEFYKMCAGAARFVKNKEGTPSTRSCGSVNEEVSNSNDCEKSRHGSPARTETVQRNHGSTP